MIFDNSLYLSNRGGANISDGHNFLAILLLIALLTPNLLAS